MQAGRDRLRDMRSVALCQDAVACLRRTTHQPPLGQLPKSWAASMQVWERMALSQFLFVDKTDWSGALRSSYQKLKTIHEEVCRNQRVGSL